MGLPRVATSAMDSSVSPRRAEVTLDLQRSDKREESDIVCLLGPRSSTVTGPWVRPSGQRHGRGFASAPQTAE